MKKAFMLIFGLILISCSLSQDDNDLEKTYNEETWEISAKASENTLHKYQIMDNYPTEGGPIITKEPDNAMVSELKRDAGIYYVYEPKVGFTGTDEVEITNNISNGAGVVAQNILKLTIKVSE